MYSSVVWLIDRCTRSASALHRKGGQLSEGAEGDRLKAGSCSLQHQLCEQQIVSNKTLELRPCHQ